MSPEAHEAIPYASAEALGDLFDETANWMLAHGQKKGNNQLAEGFMLDGTPIYADILQSEENDKPAQREQTIESYSRIIDIEELLQERELEVHSIPAVKSLLVEYMPGHYLLTDADELEYQEPTCSYVALYEKGESTCTAVFSIRKNEKNEVSSEKEVTDSTELKRYEKMDRSELTEALAAYEQSMALEIALGLHQWDVDDLNYIQAMARLLQRIT